MKATAYPKLTSSSSFLFDRLPDELIIQILCQPVIDFPTLRRMRCLSERMYRLCDHALQHALLPSTVLSVTIEQEGKSRISPLFNFMQFCQVTGHALFMSCQTLPRRYYADRANPVVRSLTIHNNYRHQHSVRRLATKDKKESDRNAMTKKNTADTTLSFCDDPTHPMKNNIHSLVARQPKNSIRPSPPRNQKKTNVSLCADNRCSCPTKLYGSYPLKTALKKGCYTLQVAQNCNALTRYQQQKYPSSWTLAYQITDILKPVQYYVKLSSLSIDVEYLMCLEGEREKEGQDNMRLNEHLKKVVHWVQHKLI
ncbi:hypothetical protein BDF20DRAFT_869095 [Mycotypha africana]|uniref:uncharacterized protein n=1 Tax=Mycotypha africana TaxID=64632 RepID=UPI0022FFF220|nr:uncharacterized protein BDF20DRAFT_869095 [Mycotypha africana]KAI8979354.1 hypothetical protein BDF20DRAFT_869095 [Mycotypha africana]